ncbi:MAG TPA: hypothetical protein VME17_06905 [Bryobacteraceae bacterium]|nr:hypothetical protein [Bryobacteraceae bacterium]
MREVLARSIRIYEQLLLLYPEELRRDFGEEMVLAFADDLQQAWGDARMAGVAQIWWYALRELITVALPGQRSSPYVLSPALAFLTTAMSESAIVWIGTHQIAHVPEAQVAAMWISVLLASSMNAFVAFVVTCFYSRSSINVLRLE